MKLRTALAVLMVIGLLSLSMVVGQDSPENKTSATEVFGFDSHWEMIAHSVFAAPVPLVFTDSTVTISLPNDPQLIQVFGEFEGPGHKFKGVAPNGDHCIVFFVANDDGVFFVLQFKDVIVAYKMTTREGAKSKTEIEYFPEGKPV